MTYTHPGADERPSLEALDPAAVEALAACLPPTTPTPERREAMRRRILSDVAELTPPMGGSTLFAGEGRWLKFDDYIDFKILHADPKHRIQTALWRMKPGANFPGHQHGQDEECLVLSGEIRIGTHRLGAGDFHLMRAGHAHPDITSETGAMLLIRAEELHEPGPLPSAFLKLRNFVKHGFQHAPD